MVKKFAIKQPKPQAVRMRKTDLYILEYIQTEMSQSQIMPQKRNVVLEFDEVSRLVQCCILTAVKK